MRSLLLIVLLVALILTAGCVREGSSTSQVTTQHKCSGVYCNGTCFDTETQTCCGDTIYLLSNQNQCCGEKMVTTQEGWVCCPDQGSYGFYRTFYKFRKGGVYINSSTQQCCNGTVICGWKESWACCGDSHYDKNTQSCCSYAYIKQGVKSCCADIPEGYNCDPISGFMTPKNRTGYNCKAGTGPGSCSEIYSQYSYEHIINNR